MSDEIHELCIHELDAVSGGQVPTATAGAAIAAAIANKEGWMVFVLRRYEGSRGANPVPMP